MRHNIFDSIPSDIVSSKDNVFANFLQTAGLYDSMKIDEDNIADLIELLKGNVKISAYCKECKQERVFLSISPSKNSSTVLNTLSLATPPTTRS